MLTLTAAQRANEKKEARAKERERERERERESERDDTDRLIGTIERWQTKRKSRENRRKYRDNFLDLHFPGD